MPLLTPHAKRMTAVLAVLCAGHLLTDAVSISTLLRAVATGDAALIFFLYLVFAFGMQAPFGWLLDHTPYARAAGWIGALVTAAGSFLLPVNPILTIIIVGIGNCLFHLGAGTVALQLEPGKARPVGIFVSTGAIGVTIGALIAAAPTVPIWPVALLLAACGAFLWPMRKHIHVEMPALPKVSKALLVTGVVLLMYAILIRSLLQLSVGFPWKTTLLATWLLTAVVVLGKALGGAAADRWGWARTTTIALLLSIPLMLVWRENAPLALAGVFLFNIPMAITLAAIARAFPKHPATAFGLTPTALFFGAVPAYTAFRGAFAVDFPGILAIASAIIAIIAGVAVMLHHSPATHRA